MEEKQGGRLWEEIDHIVRNTEGTQLGLEMLEIYEHVWEPLAEKGLLAFRRHRREIRKEAVKWREVFRAIGVPEEQRTPMLVGVVLHAAYDYLKQAEKGGVL